jgi:CNT family concentrative nucleoside transporter
LPTVVYASALFAVLYQWGIMQRVVRGFAAAAAWVTATSGAETLHAAATMILGPAEATLSIRPYLPRLTRSELLTVTAVGMANVSGLVAAAYMAFGFSPRLLLVAALITTPGAIMISKLLIPETGEPETLKRPGPDAVRTDSSTLGAVVRGTREGLRTAFAVAAALIAVVGLIALVNLGLDRFDASVQAFLGWALAPVAYMLGVGWEDCRAVGGVLGTRTALNELIAYQELGRLRGVILDRSSVIAGFALCGFANFGTLGVQLGGISALAPGRRRELLRIGPRALLAATLANFLTASIAGVLL